MHPSKLVRAVFDVDWGHSSLCLGRAGQALKFLPTYGKRLNLFRTSTHIEGIATGKMNKLRRNAAPPAYMVIVMRGKTILGKEMVGKLPGPIKPGGAAAPVPEPLYE